MRPQRRVRSHHNSFRSQNCAC